MAISDDDAPKPYPGGWQSIETAPKDGKRILLGTPAGIFIGQWAESIALSDHWEAHTFDGWLTEGGETTPGNNMGDAEQQCPPVCWKELDPGEIIWPFFADAD